MQARESKIVDLVNDGWVRCVRLGTDWWQKDGKYLHIVPGTSHDVVLCRIYDSFRLARLQKVLEWRMKM